MITFGAKRPNASDVGLSTHIPLDIFQMLCLMSCQIGLTKLTTLSRNLHHFATPYLYKIVYVFVDVRLPRNYLNDRSTWFRKALRTVDGSLIDTRHKLKAFSNTVKENPNLASLVREHHLYNLTCADANLLLESYSSTALDLIAVRVHGCDAPADVLIRLSFGKKAPMLLLRHDFATELADFLRKIQRAAPVQDLVDIRTNTLSRVQSIKLPFARLSPLCFVVHVDNAYHRKNLSGLSSKVVMSRVKSLIFKFDVREPNAFLTAFSFDASAWLAENGGFPNVQSLELHLYASGPWQNNRGLALSWHVLQIIKDFRGLEQLSVSLDGILDSSIHDCNTVLRVLCENMQKASIKTLALKKITKTWLQAEGRSVCRCEDCKRFTRMLARVLHRCPIDLWTNHDHIIARRSQSSSRDGTLCDPEFFPSFINRHCLSLQALLGGGPVHNQDSRKQAGETCADEVFMIYMIHQLRPLLAQVSVPGLRYVNLEGILFKKIMGFYEPVFERSEYYDDWESAFLEYGIDGSAFEQDEAKRRRLLLQSNYSRVREESRLNDTWHTGTRFKTRKLT